MERAPYSKRFSALQRAENSSISDAQITHVDVSRVSVLFSEPKIPQFRRNSSPTHRRRLVSVLFSEPKIPQSISRYRWLMRIALFQCSSASRKFLNFLHYVERPARPRRFQCSSASRKFLNYLRLTRGSYPMPVSVLFSEPKIPQYPLVGHLQRAVADVSVLFSEPKIPQSSTRSAYYPIQSSSFSALQRAENSSIEE